MSEDVSAKLGNYMLQGWVLTDSTCPTCRVVPMMRNKDRTIWFCAGCDGGPEASSTARLSGIPATTAATPASSNGAPVAAGRSSLSNGLLTTPAPTTTNGTSASEASSTSATTSVTSSSPTASAVSHAPSTPPTPNSPLAAVPNSPRRAADLVSELSEEERARVAARREQSDRAAEEIGRKLLQGWALLGEECPREGCYGVPLMRRPQARRTQQVDAADQGGSGEQQQGVTKGGGSGRQRLMDPRMHCVICGGEYVTERDAREAGWDPSTIPAVGSGATASRPSSATAGPSAMAVDTSPIPGPSPSLTTAPSPRPATRLPFGTQEVTPNEWSQLSTGVAGMRPTPGEGHGRKRSFDEGPSAAASSDVRRLPVKGGEEDEPMDIDHAALDVKPRGKGKRVLHPERSPMEGLGTSVPATTKSEHEVLSRTVSSLQSALLSLSTRLDDLTVAGTLSLDPRALGETAEAMSKALDALAKAKEVRSRP